MEIELKLFMMLKKYGPPHQIDGRSRMPIEPGTRFIDVLKKIGMPVEEDKIIVINGISHKQGDEVNALELKDGDIVAIFPPIAGG
ncbi:MAG: MoaD/ThiS family protein [Deltaproteobacteria bacterium]|nr:MoaD/ThiS family protein [Deltaproteobacteria bacterium]